MLHKRTVLAAALLPLAAACSDDPTGPDAITPPGTVTLRFATTSTSAATASSGVSFSHVDAADEIVLSVDGGTLFIEDVRLLVSEFELKGDDACVDGEDDREEDCEFEADPFLLDLPLGTGAVTVAQDLIAAGTYTELKFEVEDLDLDDLDDEDEDDSEKQAALTRIRDELATLYPGFPEDASMVVHGRFLPTGAAEQDAQAFTVYFDAELEIEKELVPAVVVPGTERLTVNVDPLSLIAGLDLVALDGQLVELEEVEIESAFEDVEADDEDEEDEEEDEEDDDDEGEEEDEDEDDD